MQVSTPCSVRRSTQRLSACSDEGNPAVYGEDCLRARIGIVSGIDVAVDKQQRLYRCACSRCEYKEDQPGQCPSSLLKKSTNATHIHDPPRQVTPSTPLARGIFRVLDLSTPVIHELKTTVARTDHL